jgi:hypothetical protein
LHRLFRILGEDGLLQRGIEARAIGQFHPERVPGHERFAERDQVTSLGGGALHPRFHFLQSAGAVQPAGCDLCKCESEQVWISGSFRHGG